MVTLTGCANGSSQSSTLLAASGSTAAPPVTGAPRPDPEWYPHGFHGWPPATQRELLANATEIVVARATTEQRVIALGDLFVAPEGEEKIEPVTPKHPDWREIPPIREPGFKATDTVVVVENSLKGSAKSGQHLVLSVLGDGVTACDPNDPIPLPGSRLLLFLSGATLGPGQVKPDAFYALGGSSFGRYEVDPNGRLRTDPRVPVDALMPGHFAGATIAEVVQAIKALPAK
jgi:hypothetical protein